MPHVVADHTAQRGEVPDPSFDGDRTCNLSTLRRPQTQRGPLRQRSLIWHREVLESMPWRRRALEVKEISTEEVEVEEMTIAAVGVISRRIGPWKRDPFR